METMFQTMGLSALPVFYSEREQLIDLPFVTLSDDDAHDGIVNPFHKGRVAALKGRIVEPDDDAPGKRLRDLGYDMELVTGRASAAHFHSWMHNSWQAREMGPDMYCQIHPDRAGERGIADGDKVRVATAHGSVEAVAWITSGIRDHAVFLPIGWDERQAHHPWKSVNFLTDKSQRDPISDQTNQKMLLCRVELAP